MATLLEWANYYHNTLGWNVIPVKTGTKGAAIDWEAHQTKRTDPASFRRWFEDNGCQIAIMMGPTSGVSVLDIDSKEGWFQLRGVLRDLVVPIVKTPGGEFRKHYYFQHDPDIPNIPSRATQGKWEYRSTNLIVVAPPSTGINGSKYAWVLKPK